MGLPIIGGIAKAVLPSLVGGLFGKKEPQTTTVNYAQLAANARAAGFNSLTALRHGGAANATTTGGGLSSPAFIAPAVGQGLETWFNRDQIARDEEVANIQRDLLREELQQLRSSKATSARSFGFAMPQIETNADHTTGRKPQMTEAGIMRPLARPTYATTK